MSDFRELLKQALRRIEKLEQQLAKAGEDAFPPIAIIGMACRFPGGPDRFFQSLLAGKDSVSEVPPDRIIRSPHADPQRPPLFAGLLDAIDVFDPTAFGMSPREASRIDPQQRLLLTVCLEALEHAGIVPSSSESSSGGVYVGMSEVDFHEQVDKLPIDSLDHQAVLGSVRSVAAGRIAYSLGLHGPALTLDTACSSSLAAVHLASLSLWNGDARYALAGGVNVLLSEQAFDRTRVTQALSPDGKCKTFDAQAKGFVRGEGCGMVVLKRLDFAQQDGDRILAVVRGSAMNQDGRSAGLTAPSGLAQEALLRTALARAKIEPSQLGFFEAHGTGTPLGDPIEVEAIRAVYGSPQASERPLYLGAVKSHIGHLEAAAGIAGLIKTIMILRTGHIPANLHFQALNPRIDLSGSRIRIPTANVHFPQTSVRLAAVSSFGISGTNVHVVLEQAAPAPTPQPQPIDTRPQLLVLQAETDSALRSAAAQLHHALRNNPQWSLGDVAYTLALRKIPRPQRTAIIARDREDAAALLAQLAKELQQPRSICGEASSPHPVAFLCSGQGTQWAQMGKQLYQHFAPFRTTIDECSAFVSRELGGSLIDILFADPNSTAAALLDQTEWTQTALFSLEYALFRQWESWGIRPALLLGHSVGELAAACIAGVFSLPDALQLCAARGRLMQALPKNGAMCVVDASEREALATMDHLGMSSKEISVAAINAPNQTVLSGVQSAIDAVCHHIAGQGRRVQKLRVSHAFHSPLIDPMLEPFAKVAARIHYQEPRIPLLSNVFGRPATREFAEPRYWVEQARAPVRFANCLQHAAATGINAFVELGPGGSLLGLAAKTISADHKLTLIASLRKGSPDSEVLLGALAQLYVHGTIPDLKRLFPVPGKLLELPTYPFARDQFHLAVPAIQAAPHTHSLLGDPVRCTQLSDEHVWQRQISLGSSSWLRDHQISGVPLFPAAGFLALAFAAGRQVLGSVPLSLTQVHFREALTLHDGQPSLLQTTLTRVQPAVYALVQSSGLSHSSSSPVHFVRHTKAELRTVDSQSVRPPNRTELSSQADAVPVAELYDALHVRGIHYGPSFRAITELHVQPWGVWGLARLCSAPEDAQTYPIHPTLLDACMHGLAALPQSHSLFAMVPVALGTMTLYRRAGSQVRFCLRTEVHSDKRTSLMVSITITDPDRDELVATIEDLEVSALSAGSRHAPLADALFEQRWLRQQLPARVPIDRAGTWVILGQTLLAQRLCQQLRNRGCIVCSSLTEAVRTETLLSGIVFLESLSDPQIEEGPAQTQAVVDSNGWQKLLQLVQTLSQSVPSPPPRLIVVTERAQAVENAQTTRPEQAIVFGMAATVRSERPELRCRRIDMGSSDSETESAALAEEILADTDAEPIALREGQRFEARLARAPDALAQPVKTSEAAGRPYALQTPQPGRVNSPTLIPVRMAPPGPREVTITVHCAGLNFRDVLIAMGVLQSAPGTPPFRIGGECAGVISAVGSEVRSFRPGDPVIAIAEEGFRSEVVVDCTRVFPIPQGIPFLQAGGLLVAPATAYYSLHYVAQLSKGERVFIHAAAGGVGTSAVEYAQHVGAEVFASAGSETKRAYLRQRGVRYVTDSRNDTFVEDIRNWTHGEGVDVVLNTVSGTLLRQSLGVLRSFGRFVDLTKRDHMEDGYLRLAPFLHNLTYSLFDLQALIVKRPEQFRTAVQELLRLFEQKVLSPLPIESFPIDQADAAFRHMSNANHMGKIVLSFQDRNPWVTAAPTAIDSQGTYLVTGGLGALGLLSAQLLCEKGARQILLLGRHAIEHEAGQKQVAALRAQGAQVTIALADVADREALQRVLADIPKAHPLRGVIHAAGVVDDATLQQQTIARFRHVLLAKVQGALHLHQLTKSLPLDFFVLFSSLAAPLGARGQANYVAANSFLDSLAQHRQALGLPGLSVNLGQVAGRGMAQTEAASSHLKRIAAPLSETEFRFALGQLLCIQQSQVGIGRINFTGLSEQVSNIRGWSYLHDLLSATPSAAREPTSAKQFISQLRSASHESRKLLVEQAIRTQLGVVLQIPSDRQDSIPERTPWVRLGLDSLLALELKNRFENVFEVTITVEEMLDQMSIHHAKNLLLSMLNKESSESASAYEEGTI